MQTKFRSCYLNYPLLLIRFTGLPHLSGFLTSSASSISNFVKIIFLYLYFTLSLHCTIWVWSDQIFLLFDSLGRKYILKSKSGRAVRNRSALFWPRLVSSCCRGPECHAGGWRFKPETRPTLRVLNYLRRICCLCYDICDWLDVLVFSDKEDKP